MALNFSFLDRWYEAVKRLARHKHATPALGFIAFIESIFFPIPTAIMLLPMAQADHKKVWRYAAICTVMSVLGGIVGYGLGWFAFDNWALPLLEKLGKAHSMESYRTLADEYGVLAVFGAGLTPFPYKVITILSGALKLNFFAFLIASILARSAQFFLIAAIVWKFGDQAETFIKKHFAALTISMFAVIVAGWAVWKVFLS